MRGLHTRPQTDVSSLQQQLARHMLSAGRQSLMSAISPLGDQRLYPNFRCSRLDCTQLDSCIQSTKGKCSEGQHGITAHDLLLFPLNRDLQLTHPGSPEINAVHLTCIIDCLLSALAYSHHLSHVTEKCINHSGHSPQL